MIHTFGYALLGCAWMSLLISSAKREDWFDVAVSTLIPIGVICVAWII